MNEIVALKPGVTAEIDVFTNRDKEPDIVVCIQGNDDGYWSNGKYDRFPSQFRVKLTAAKINEISAAITRAKEKESK